jgi:hypothetical protein
MKEKYPDFYNMKMQRGEDRKGTTLRFDDIY